MQEIYYMNKVRFGGNLGLVWCLGYAVKWGNAEMAKMHEHEQVAAVLTATAHIASARQQNKLLPQGWRDNMPPLMAVRLQRI